jgi:hypothetical protein
MLQGARYGPAAGLPGQRRRPDGGRHPKLVHWRRAGPALHPDRCDDQPANQALLSTRTGRTAQPADGRRMGLVLQHVRSSTLSFARSLHRSLFSANLRLAFARLLAHSGTRLLQVAHLLPPTALHNPLVYSQALPQSLTLNAARSSSRPSIRYRKCFYSNALPCTLGVHSPDGITGHLKNVKNT